MMYSAALLVCALAASALSGGAATCGADWEPCCNGHRCNEGLECAYGENGMKKCMPPPPPCKNAWETCDPQWPCCEELECYEGKCVLPECVPPEMPPQPNPPTPPFPVCPNGGPAEGKGTIKFCVEDLENAKEGQATCGTPTCNALCEFVCGRAGDYTPDMCNNSGGGNCQGVIAPSGVDFKGGPCCGCVVEKACPDLA